MLELRTVRLSVYYFLKDKLDTSGYGSTGYFNDELVTLLASTLSEDDVARIVTPDSAQGLSDLELVLPIVSIDQVGQREYPYQLGSGPGTSRPFVISIFGREEAETDDLAQQIYEWFRDNDIDLNNYNEGFPPSVVPTKVGTIEILNAGLAPVKILGSPNVADKYRYDVTFNAVTYISDGSEVTFA